jgi:hypothetical protein
MNNPLLKYAGVKKDPSELLKKESSTEGSKKEDV